MYSKVRKYLGIGYLILFAIAVIATPEGKMFTVFGMLILAVFLLGLERLVKAILGVDSEKHQKTTH